MLITLVALAITVAAAIALVRVRDTAAALCLAAVLGGAAGNLADRLVRAPGFGRGAVVDWIHLAGYSPSFNLADAAIRLGAVGVIIALLAGSRRSGGQRTG